MSPRALAIAILGRVRATDAYLNVVLDSQLQEHQGLDPRDAALVTELCYGTTRRQLTLDHALERFVDRRLEQIEDRVLAALRIGAYQLFYMRVPKHAAVAETVEALKEHKLSRATGFLNAVLRRLSALETIPLPAQSDRAEYLSIRESHPLWLVKRWIRRYGEARAEAMLVGDNTAPPVVVRVNSAKRTRDELVRELREVGVAAEPTAISPVGVVLPSVGRVEDVYGYREGLWQVQDEAAQLVGVFAQLPTPGASAGRVLDACAAPGGKACHLAERQPVLAIDLHAHKLRKIEAEAARLGLSENLEVRAHDATTPLDDSLGPFHAVLLDAPCSGLGTLRRHPELRYRRREEDLVELASIQRALLERCAETVSPGGLLVYAVCSTEPQEGSDQIEMFLRSHPEFTSEPPTLETPYPQWQGYLRTLPGPEGLDGFFAARLRRMY